MPKPTPKDGFLMVSRYDPAIHHRRSIRLKGYDYAQAGAYFITICIHSRECLFGGIVETEVVLSASGGIVRDEWVKSSAIRSEIQLGEFVVMPNHVHAIAHIVDGSGAARGQKGDRPVAPTTAGPRPKSIGALVGGFKSAVTTRINAMRNNPGAPVWQRGYWEHVIRDEADDQRLAEYITHNPQRWADDSLHPNAASVGATGRSPARRKPSGSDE